MPDLRVPPAAPSALPADRRLSPRLPCGLDTMRCVIAGVMVNPWLLPLRDVSAGRLSFVLGERLAPGAALEVKLFHPVRHFFCTVPARVVYSLGQPTGEFLTGAAFTRELTADEARGLF
jgi:hypothetical protein